MMNNLDQALTRLQIKDGNIGWITEEVGQRRECTGATSSAAWVPAEPRLGGVQPQQCAR